MNARSPAELVQLVAGSSLFSGINPEQLNELGDQLEWVTLAGGEELFHEGAAIDALYVVVEGQLEASKQQANMDGDPTNDRLVLSQIGPATTIGEMQILTGGTRSATVTATLPSGLVRFPKPAFDKLLARNKQIVQELSKTIMPRLFRDQLVDVLPNLFGELDDAMLRNLESKLTWVHLPRGHILCYEGEPSDSFYIVISGRLQVLIRGDSTESQLVGEVSQGESVGEMGVFTGERRTATVIASRDTELVRYSKAEFDEFTRLYPQLMRHLTQLLIGRLQRGHRKTNVAKLSVNTLVAPGSQGAPVDEFALRLRTAICGMSPVAESNSEPCLLLTSDEVDRLLEIPGIAQATENEPNDLRLRSWLSQQEKKYKVILLQTDPTVTEWTRRCIRSSDDIIYVAASDHPTAGTAVAGEIHLQETRHLTRRRRAVMLVHRDNVIRPNGTMRWLLALGLSSVGEERQSGTRHFHVRQGSDGDYQRIGRYVTGREVGLVLSGGGARGFAHVGCIQAMQELNIPIDMIGGVSMGSLVSAAYAYDPERFFDTIHTIKSQLKGVLFDLTAPVVSLARGRRFDRRLKGWFNDAFIEDLWVPYFCVSSNLTKAKIEIFDSDHLWWAVRASGTLPGLTSPMIRDGCLLFDGCLLDNLPMDVMRERMGTSTVIAVDVVPPHDLKVNLHVKVNRARVQSPSGWWLLWNKISPFGTRVELPNIVSIMQRAGELGSVYGRQKLIESRLADIYLQPPVDDIYIADFKKVDDAAKIGYDHCKQRLGEWWANHSPNSK